MTSNGKPAQPARNEGRLTSAGFLGLLATQFLGSLNDNMFRWLAVPLAKPVIGAPEALSLGLACFTLPYLLLLTPAGYLADKFSKRTVIVGCKLAEIVIMVLGIATILIGNIYMLFVVVTLMGAQAALFGPAKFGSIPEMLGGAKLSKGNGWMGMVTVVSSALGFVAGNWLFSLTKPSMLAPEFGKVLPSAAALLGLAIVGWLTSLLIPRLPAADPARPLPPNPVVETWRSLGLLGRDKTILRTALGIAFFWMLASLAQMNIDTYGIDELNLEQKDIGPLLGVLVMGLAVGSVLAGLWSGGKVELGIVPLGALGIAASAFMLFIAGDHVNPALPSSLHKAHVWSCVWLFTLGASSGLFDIPLESYLQHRSEVRTRGVILAASNFVSFTCILGASGLFYLLHKGLGMSASEIFLVTGLGTLPVAVYVFALLPDATIHFLVWVASKTFYSVRVYGRENLPDHGGALLVANHVSWLDGIFLLLTSSRHIRMIAYADYVRGGFKGWLAKIFGVIPIDATAGPKAIVQSLKIAREAVEGGELVCIFAEGQITRTGQLQPFQRGMMRIVEGTGAPVVPVYLDELWGSAFSYHGGRLFWKRPRRFPYPVSIWFGKPLAAPDDVNEVRQAVQNLGVDAVEERKGRQRVLPRSVVRTCRKSLFRMKIADSSGAALSGGKLLTSILVMRRLLERLVLGTADERVGVLLPPTNGAAIANAALTLSGRVAVNLNYTMSDADVNFCIREAGIRHVLTSRAFLKRKPMQLEADVVLLEDLPAQASAGDKILAALSAYLEPALLLERRLGLQKIQHNDLLTIVFTSGSTGRPKGVMLSHYNVLSNIIAVNELFDINRRDTLLGIMPFFHSFGFTLGLWAPLVLPTRAVYHVNPLDARQVGEMAEKYSVTILMGTPTFVKAYIKRCEKQQFAKLNLVVVGAEKLPLPLAEEFREKFGVYPTEGYGATELSPLAACNVPDHRSGQIMQQGTKHGTVGRAIPGVSVKIVDPDTGLELPPGQDGLLWFKGPNVMQGYLNNPEATADAIHNGWYNTKDIAAIDEEGFIRITGRVSRFSKIGGEMVPHGRLEELLLLSIGSLGDDAAPMLAVTSVPDERKGERLVVLHRPLDKSIDALRDELAEAGCPNLWIPARDSFIEVAEIPLLGSGKLDLKRLREMALEAQAHGMPSVGSER